ncbi:MAG: hypothetical protein WAU41_08610 [Gaiellaceae bacterium]
MVRYFYAWLPFAAVFGTAVILTIPYLALIALAAVVLAAIAALAWALIALPLRLGRTISHHRHHTPATPRTAAARTLPAAATALVFANPPRKHGQLR